MPPPPPPPRSDDAACNERGRALCGREGGRSRSQSVCGPSRSPSCCVLNDLGEIPGDTLMPLVLYHVCMRACPEALFWRSGRINGERERDLLCDADDKRDKGGDEGREAEGGGLIKSKARQGGARRSLARRRPRNWRPAYHHRPDWSGAIFAAQGIVIAVGSFFLSKQKGLAGDEG